MKSIVFCSSQRFKNELSAFIEELHLFAKKKKFHLVVLRPNFDDDSPKNLHLLPEKERLKNSEYRATVAGKVYDHLFRKVNVADVCFIFNKNGYIGANTNGELFAAAMAGKMIYSLEEKILMGHYPTDLYEEPSSRKLIHDVVSSPKELLQRLI